MATLGYERVAIATGRVNTRRAVSDIVADVAGMTGADGRPLGADPRVDVLEIRWPSGKVQTLRDIPADRTLKVVEP